MIRFTNDTCYNIHAATTIVGNFCEGPYNLACACYISQIQGGLNISHLRFSTISKNLLLVKISGGFSGISSAWTVSAWFSSRGESLWRVFSARTGPGIGQVWDGKDVDWIWTMERVGRTGKMSTPGKTTAVRTGFRGTFLSMNLVILFTALKTFAGLWWHIVESHSNR